MLFNTLLKFVFLFCMFIFYFLYSVFLYCFVYFSHFVCSCLFIIFVQVYRPGYVSGLQDAATSCKPDT